MPTITFKARTWRADDSSSEQKIIISGITEESESVLIEVVGYNPEFYIELPKNTTFSWNSDRCAELETYIQENNSDLNITGFRREKRFLLRGKIPVNCIAVSCATFSDAKSLSYRIRKNQHHVGGGVGILTSGMLKTHEEFIDPCEKFRVKYNLTYSGWISVKLHDLSNEECFISNIGGVVSVDDITPAVDKHIVGNDKYMCFDIETYSKNHNAKNPDPHNPENTIVCISAIFGRFSTGIEKRYRLTLGYVLDSKDIIIHRFNTEKDLIVGFTEVIANENPDVFVGYNIYGFDWGYIMDRAEKNNIFDCMRTLSRHPTIISSKYTKEWESSAYGKRKYSWIDCCGRLHIDVYMEMTSKYKFSDYKLETVSEHFLKQHKIDLDHKQQFKLYQFYKEVCMKYITYKNGEFSVKFMNASDVKEFKTQLKEFFSESEEPLQSYYQEARVCKSKDIETMVRKPLTILGEYCDQDTVLPIRLMEKLNMWIDMQESSNIWCIPMEWIHTRGQQIRVFNQLYTECRKHKIIINQSDKDKTPYQGATVLEAIPGYYRNVATVDFSSLYPSIMQAYNVDFTSYVGNESCKDDPRIPECFKAPGSSHRGCIHDTQKRKIKKEDVLCHEGHCYFLKPKLDGTNLGILPIILKNLLSNRKRVKKEMEILEASVRMNEGKQTDDDVKLFQKNKLDIVEVGSIPKAKATEMKNKALIFNAQQLALKVSANSVYGSLGAPGKNGFSEAAEVVTAVGRENIKKTILFIKEFMGKRDQEVNIVYGDTDSCMMQFVGKNVKESFELARMVAKAATHYLKCGILGYEPGDMEDEHKYTAHFTKEQLEYYNNCAIDLSFENLYKIFFLLEKKKYIGISCNEEGHVIKEVKKGILLARRDNCRFARDAYATVLKKIMEEHATTSDVQNEIRMVLNKLFSRQYNIKDFIIVKSIKELQEYAVNYDSNSKRYYTDMVKEGNKWIKSPASKPFLPTSPTDKRLIYRNAPHIALALKLTERGDIIPPNTRLEYVFLKSESKSEMQADKIEDFTYFKENRTVLNLELDYLYYIEHMFVNPIGEIVKKRFGRDMVNFVKPLVEYKELADSLKDDNLKNALKRAKEWKDKLLVIKEKGNPDKYKKHRELIKSINRCMAEEITNGYNKKYGIRRTLRRPKKGEDKVERDANMLKDFYKARVLYDGVVAQLKQMFKPKIRIRIVKKDKR